MPGQFIKTRHKREMARAKFSGQRMFGQKKAFLRKCIFTLSLFQKIFHTSKFPFTHHLPDVVLKKRRRRQTIIWSICNFFRSFNLISFWITNYFFKIYFWSPQNMYIFLGSDLWVCMSVCPHVCLFVCLSVCLSICAESALQSQTHRPTHRLMAKFGKVQSKR